MSKLVAGVAGAALLLNVNVASAAKRLFEQKSGLNAFVGATADVNECLSWSISSSLSEVSIKTEPGAKEVSNRAIVSFFLSNSCDGTTSSFAVDLPDVAKLTGNLTGASLDLNMPVTLTKCGIVEGVFECNDSTAPMKVSLKWAATSSPVRSKQHTTNLAPDGVRSSFHIEGNTRDATTTGSLSVGGQTYVLTTDNVNLSSLTSDAHMFVVLK